MLKWKKSTFFWLFSIVFLVAPIFSSLLPRAYANVDPSQLECWDFEYKEINTGEVSAGIVANPSGEEDCSVGTTQYVLQEQDPNNDGENQSKYTAGGSPDIFVDSCSGEAGIVGGSELVAINVTGTPNYWPCSSPDPGSGGGSGGGAPPVGGGGTGSVRMRIQISNLDDVIANQEVGPFVCRAIEVLGGTRDYRDSVPAIPIGGDLPFNTISCDISAVPEGEYYLELWEGVVSTDPDRGRVITGRGDVDVVAGTAVTENWTISLKQFEEGSVGFAQTDFLSEEQTCKTGSFNVPFRFILCPLVIGLFNALDFIYTRLIIPVLIVSPLSDSAQEGSPEAVLYEIWNDFRIIANVAFIAVLLFAIFGQSLAGFQMFSAYDIRRIVPRLVIGVIAVQLSWYIVGFMVDLFNILGAGVRGIMLAPVDGLNFSVNFDFEGNWFEIASTIGIIGGVTAGLWVGGVVMGLPLLLFPIFMGMTLAFVTIVLRKALILILIITAPVAFVAWILPNTARVFSVWWSFFWKALLLYPLIIALISAGELLAKVMSTSNTAAEGTQVSVFNSIMAIGALLGPFLLVPFTFQFAGGLLSTLAGNLDRRGKNLNRQLFGDPLDHHSYRGRRRQKQLYGRVKRKGRLLRAASRIGNYEADPSKGGARVKNALARASGARLLAKGVKGLGGLTGNYYADFEAHEHEEANHHMAKLASFRGNADLIPAILGNRHYKEGSWKDKLDKDGNVVRDADGNVVKEWQGRELDPSAVQAAKSYRKDPMMIQAALNFAQGDIAGNFEKTKNLYRNFVEGEGPVGWRSTEAERDHMFEVAADHNASRNIGNRQGGYSPDWLYRDPGKEDFGLKDDVGEQARYMNRVAEREGSDRALNEYSASAWMAMTEAQTNARNIYDNNVATHGSFDASKLSANEQKLLKESMRVHEAAAVMRGPSTRSPGYANPARDAFVKQSRQFYGFNPGDARTAANQQYFEDMRSLQ